MNNVSTKRLFAYFSLALIFGYSVFVLLVYNANVLSGLYTLEKCSIYYILVYVLLSAVSYTIDTQTRKEPGLLTLFCFPMFSLVFLLSIMLIASVSVGYIVLAIAVFVALYGLGYLTYKRWIGRIMLIKKGYENILLIYVIIHLFIVLFIAFKIIGLL